MDVYLFGPLFLDFIHTTLFKGLWSNGGSGLFKLWPKKNERQERTIKNARIIKTSTIFVITRYVVSCEW